MKQSPGLPQTRLLTKRTVVPLLSIVLILLTGLAAYAQSGYPQPADSYINDFAGILTAEDEANVRALFTDLRTKNGIEAVVVTIGSINDYGTGDATIESFATNLFNDWGIGNREENNGVLFLVAVNDRKVRIEVGSGYENSQNQNMQEVINEHILPSFRQNNYSRGIYRGARAMVGKLTGNLPPDLEAAAPQPVQAAPTSVSIPVNSQRVSSSAGRDVPLGWLFGGGAAVLGAAGLGVQQYLRHRKRYCPDCKTLMVRLDEVSDDIYLDSGQKAEELLNSVDYDVWKCPTCNTHTVGGYTNWLAWFKRCPQCHYRTVTVDSETLEHPTYTSTGRKRVTRDCSHCKYHDTEIVILPMRKESSSSSNSSSRSSGGSSFGGGRSSGGGASGSW